MSYCNGCEIIVGDETEHDETIDRFFRPAKSRQDDDRARILLEGLERIESIISSFRGDPGKLYPLDVRLARITGRQ